jgi:hypothetical protein
VDFFVDFFFFEDAAVEDPDDFDAGACEPDDLETAVELACCGTR